VVACSCADEIGSRIAIRGWAGRLFLSRSRSDELLDGDRKAANAYPSRVPDRIGNRSRRAGDPDFPNAFDAELINVGVGFLNQDGLERRHVGVDRDMVVGEVRVHDPA
jgi:hypothetical protein